MFNAIYNPETTSATIAAVVADIERIATKSEANQPKLLAGQGFAQKIETAIQHVNELFRIVTGEDIAERHVVADETSASRVFAYAEHVKAVVATDAESLRTLSNKLYTLASMAKGAK